MPVGIALVVLFNIVKNWINLNVFGKKDWMEEGEGRVFFEKPKGIIASFLWDCYLNQSMYVGQFLLAGSNDDSIQHTWQDIILTKDFWRRSLERVGARLPREIGRWTGEKMEWNVPLGDADVVVKLPDAYLGIGDSFWNGPKHPQEEQDYRTQPELEALLSKTYGEGTQYEGREALVLELVRPKKELGVHALDIITLRTPDDKVQVLSVLLWTDCARTTSHSCEAGFTMDLDGKVIAPVAWYSPHFTHQKDNWTGQVMPGVRKAIEQCVMAHSRMEEKWLVAVGWDCMVQDNNECVFFEGNFAGARTPRRMFLNFECLKTFITKFFWPFGTGASARPGRQSFGGPLEKVKLTDFLYLGLKSSADGKKGKSKPSALIGDRAQVSRARSISM